MDPPPTTAFLDISLCMEGLSPITAKKVVQSITSTCGERTRLLLVQARTRDSLTHQKAIATSTNFLLLEHTLFAGLPFSCITLFLLPTRHLVPSANVVVCPAVRICGYRDHRNGTHFEFFLLPSCEQHYYRYLRAARCEVRGAQLFLVARMYAKILFYK